MRTTNALSFTFSIRFKMMYVHDLKYFYELSTPDEFGIRRKIINYFICIKSLYFITLEYESI